VLSLLRRQQMRYRGANRCVSVHFNVRQAILPAYVCGN
jgi:hypothetical protein